MALISIDDTIQVIEATEDPLSADIGIVRDRDRIWLYDVGSRPEAVAELTGEYRVVLSHFHADHVGNLDRIKTAALYVSDQSFAHVGRGTILRQAQSFGEIRVFPLPSSHAKGCLGMEVGGKYAFVGDALYSRLREGCYVFNAQLLQEEIAVLSRLQAPWLLVSHFKGLIREREAVLRELEALYGLRDRNRPEIEIPIGAM